MPGLKQTLCFFSELRYEYNEVFAVVPNLNALNNTCIQGLRLVQNISNRGGRH